MNGLFHSAALVSKLIEPIFLPFFFSLSYFPLSMLGQNAARSHSTRLLTLPSGWRIQFTDNVNFIFETHDLIHASPATISRMGIVNLRQADS